MNAPVTALSLYRSTKAGRRVRLAHMSSADATIQNQLTAPSESRSPRKQARVTHP